MNDQDVHRFKRILNLFITRFEEDNLMRMLRALQPLGVMFTVIALILSVLTFLRESEIRRQKLIKPAMDFY